MIPLTSGTLMEVPAGGRKPPQARINPIRYYVPVALSVGEG